MAASFREELVEALVALGTTLRVGDCDVYVEANGVPLDMSIFNLSKYSEGSGRTERK